MQIDVADLEAHRPALTGHCYRMLGSAADADDAVQETLVRAWRSMERFEGRSSVRTWLYRIATNVCLDSISDNAKRMRPMEEGPASPIESARLETKERTHWLEPIAEAKVISPDDDPFQIAVQRQSIRLAFVAALQHLPPRQRAALLLAEVVGWSATEIAECLDMTVAAVNSGLQRARATMAARNASVSQAELDEEQLSLVDQYVDAFQRYDLDALVSLLRDDATFSMPPYSLWLQGPEPVRWWLTEGPGSVCRGSKLIPVAASGAPSFAHYHPGKEPGTYDAWAIVVLELDGNRITGWNSFLDAETLFPMFGLPRQLLSD